MLIKPFPNVRGTYTGGLRDVSRDIACLTFAAGGYKGFKGWVIYYL
jgi:hypothetical protein